MAQPDSELVTFNNAVAHATLRWWELQSSSPGYDRDTLYVRMERQVGTVHGKPEFETRLLRIRAEHREHGAALVLEVVQSIPASDTRNVSKPGTPIEHHDELRLPTGSGIFTEV